MISFFYSSFNDEYALFIAVYKGQEKVYSKVLNIKRAKHENEIC